jgi:hypothetical protein
LLSGSLASNLSQTWHSSQLSLGESPDPRQHPFRLSKALSSRLWIPAAFRPLAFASWIVLFPLGTSAVLASGLLTWVRPPWGSHVPHHREPTGVGAFYTPGAWCPCWRRVGIAGHRNMCMLCHASAPVLPSWSVIVSGNFQITEPQRRFTSVHPSSLSLAWVVLMTNTALGLCLSRQTLALLAVPGETGNRLWTHAWMWPFFRITRLVRPRVAPTPFQVTSI